MPTPSLPTYTHSQLLAFFNHIHLFAYEQYQTPLAPLRLPTSPLDLLDFLTQIQQHVLATIPFENLSIHYSPHHTISLDPAALYTKVVERGHGGYCMELNCFFLTVLRSLGFEVYSVGARVSLDPNGAGEEYGGW